MSCALQLTLHLSDEEQARLQSLAENQGLSLEEYAQSVLKRLAEPHDARSLRALPRAERNRLLAEQAASAAPLYEADLARPVAERELTAFTALDGEEFHKTHG